MSDLYHTDALPVLESEEKARADARVKRAPGSEFVVSRTRVYWDVSGTAPRVGMNEVMTYLMIDEAGKFDWTFLPRTANFMSIIDAAALRQNFEIIEGYDPHTMVDSSYIYEIKRMVPA